MQTQVNIDRGMPPDEAASAAKRHFGNVTRIREDIHTMETLSLDTVWQDVRFGLRLLRRNPIFAVVAILTLALGVGANSAIFQLVNAVRLRSLPVTRPVALVSIRIDQHGKGRVGRGYPGGFFSEPLWQAIRTEQQSFSSVFAWGSDRWDLSAEGETVWARGLYVSGAFFPALGVHAEAGRLLIEADDQYGCATPGVVLSHDFWRTRYGGDPGVIGRTITLDRRAFDVVGVAQSGFFGVEVGRTFDVALPLCAEPLLRGRQAGTGRRDFWWLDVMGRLKPGWTVERAQQHIAALSPGIFQATVAPTYKPDWAANYTAFTLTATAAPTGISFVRNAYATQLWALLGATGVVLLLTCANLANLMLARSTARGREIAVRLAIGASRARVVRQMVTESALIAGAGALGGLLIARWISLVLVRFLNAGTNRIFVNLNTDWRVVAFAVASTVVMCVLFGVSPALRTARRDPVTAMQSGGRSSTDAHEAVALRRSLVIVQVGLSTVLVVAAVLFGRTLRNLGAVDLGFDPNVIVANVDLRRTTTPPEGRTKAFADIVARLRAVPGVRQAAETLIPPLSGATWNSQIAKSGAVQDGDVFFNSIGGDYFRAMGMPMVAGRTFDERDRMDAPLTAIVNETFARRYFPNTDPLGQTFEMDVPRTPKPTYQIVGLVADSKYGRIREERGPEGARFSATETNAIFLPIAYLAASQDTAPPDFRIIVKADLPQSSLARPLTRAITEVAPGAAVSYDAVTAYIDVALATERLMAWLSALFGILAIMIAAIGLYGVLSYLVTRRKVEIGIRMALGAEPRTVVGMVLAESGFLVGLGLLAGLALAIAASRYVATLFYGVTPLDPLSFALGSGALGLFCLIAAWIPARRASRLLPTIALRD
jgi:predicted permease